jgi:alpha-galactosidase
MTNCKIVFIGGGSFNWGPQIIRDFIVTPELQNSTLVLHDINRQAARNNQRIAELLKKQAGASIKVEVVDSRRAALDGADYVVLAISTGGLEAWRLDMEIPDRYGCRQTIADTVGPGGMSRALRNIPVIVSIARDMEELCPHAWLLNVTNPMTALTRSVWRETSIRCVGLCHEVFGFLGYVRRALKVTNQDITFNAAGINHCIWVLELGIKGKDGLEMIRRKWRKEGYPRKDIVAPLLFEVFGYMPIWNGRHLSEFFPHFLTPESGYGERYGFLDQMVTVKDRFASMARGRKRWLGMVEGKRLPELEIGDEPIIPIILAMETNQPYHFIANWPNRGQISNLPLEAVVETRAVADAGGVTPLAAGPLPEAIRSVLARHVSNQELIVEAAVTGSRQAALQAFVNDPLINNFEGAKAMLDDLLAAHAKYLPQFKKTRK